MQTNDNLSGSLWQEGQSTHAWKCGLSGTKKTNSFSDPDRHLNSRTAILLVRENPFLSTK